jgi:hypothetical protein
MEKNPVCVEKNPVKMEKNFAWIRRLSMMHVPLAVTARVIVSAEPF